MILGRAKRKNKDVFILGHLNDLPNESDRESIVHGNDNRPVRGLDGGSKWSEIYMCPMNYDSKALRKKKRRPPERVINASLTRSGNAACNVTL